MYNRLINSNDIPKDVKDELRDSKSKVSVAVDSLYNYMQCSVLSEQYLEEASLQSNGKNFENAVNKFIKSQPQLYINKMSCYNPPTEVLPLKDIDTTVVTDSSPATTKPSVKQVVEIGLEWYNKPEVYL